MIFRVTYKIYDDFGELIKISLDKPIDNSYTFVKVEELIFSTDMLEEALM